MGKTNSKPDIIGNITSGLGCKCRDFEFYGFNATYKDDDIRRYSHRKKRQVRKMSFNLSMKQTIIIFGNIRKNRVPDNLGSKVN